MSPQADSQGPKTDLDTRYSSPGAAPKPWAEAVAELAAAEISWVATVRPDGRPHVTPLMTVWLDGALHFSTGATERKGLNLDTNPYVVLTTGTNRYAEGCDLVVEGESVRVTDDGRLRELAAAWETKYGPDWHYEVGDGVFVTPDSSAAPPSTEGAEEAGRAVVYRVAPRTAFGFGREGGFSQTRWSFTG
ncbi:pyridoxamine 5'-phosphate oxidase family protein [Streptomyces sp. NPDC088387]|uniref:pyridoxamine 5'-phosphate oxidase family protein n=1 Tax=Streptomyces sp. NPDC088387 TaxID=3365859 RepID=UPI00380494B0